MARDTFTAPHLNAWGGGGGQVDKLVAGEVGYLAASIKAVADARVGDTLTLKKSPATEPLPGRPLRCCGSRSCGFTRNSFEYLDS